MTTQTQIERSYMESLKESIAKQERRIAAYELLIKSLEEQRTHLRLEYAHGKEALDTLQSERDANEFLTNQVELQAKEIARLKLGEFICQKCGLRKDSEQPKTHDF